VGLADQRAHASTFECGHVFGLCSEGKIYIITSTTNYPQAAKLPVSEANSPFTLPQGEFEDTALYG